MQEFQLERRYVAGGMAAAVVGFAAQLPSHGRVLTQRGIAGGGLIQLAAGEASFSLFVARLAASQAGSDADTEIVAGSIRWVDRMAGLILTSTTIATYDVVEIEVGEMRAITGAMSVEGAGSYSFAMEVVDVGPPGSGEDWISFGIGESVTRAGEATPATGRGVAYAVSGPLVAGDVQIVEFDTRRLN
jgi:hypothetical protein